MVVRTEESLERAQPVHLRHQAVQQEDLDLCTIVG